MAGDRCKADSCSDPTVRRLADAMRGDTDGDPLHTRARVIWSRSESLLADHDLCALAPQHCGAPSMSRRTDWMCGLADQIQRGAERDRFRECFQRCGAASESRLTA